MPARIVVVHDDPTFRDPLVASLESRGHEVAAFDDAMQAWDALEEARRVEVLITRIDFGPGKPHGIALARSARARRPGVQVVFAARREFAADAEGIGLFFPLPASVPEVAAAVEGLLSDVRLGHPLATDEIAV